MLCCIPLGLLIHALEQGEPATQQFGAIPLDVAYENREFEVEPINRGNNMQGQTDHERVTRFDEEWSNPPFGKRRSPKS